MKTWLVPICLVLLVIVGFFVISLVENKPILWSKPAATPYSAPTYYPPASSPVAPIPAAPVPTVPPPATKSTSTEPNFIKIISSSSRQTFIQGANNYIEWEGEDLHVVDVILTDMNGNRFGYIESHDFTNAAPDPYMTDLNGVYWTGQSVSPSSMFYENNNQVDISPGSYKIVVVNPVTGVSSTLPITLVAAGR